MNARTTDMAIFEDSPVPITDSTRSIIAGALALCDDSPIVIINPQQADDAAAELATIKGAYKRIEEERMTYTRPLDGVKEKIINNFRNVLEPLEARERAYKLSLQDWVNRERARVAAERKKAEDEAAAEQERLRKEAERNAKKLEKKGDAEAAQLVRDTVPVVVPAAPVAAVTTPKGFSTREVWKGECTDKMALIKAVAAGTASEELLTVNESALNKTASALKKLFKIPGCRAFIEQGSSSRSV